MDTPMSYELLVWIIQIIECEVSTLRHHVSPLHVMPEFLPLENTRKQTIV
jgi:hypothetical protein